MHFEGIALGWILKVPKLQFASCLHGEFMFERCRPWRNEKIIHTPGNCIWSPLRPPLPISLPVPLINEMLLAGILMLVNGGGAGSQTRFFSGISSIISFVFVKKRSMSCVCVLVRQEKKGRTIASLQLWQQHLLQRTATKSGGLNNREVKKKLQLICSRNLDTTEINKAGPSLLLAIK